MPRRLTQPARRATLLTLAAAGWLLASGCSSSSGAAIGVSHPTLIEVAPEVLLGDLTCSDADDAVHRYVATLVDVTDLQSGAGGAGAESTDEAGAAGQEFSLPSSAPTACDTSVGFGFVVEGRRYRVEVDAYDTDAVEPRAAGSPVMVVGDPGDGKPPASDAPIVQPRWHAVCDDTVASAERTVRARGCGLLQDQPSRSLPGSLRLDSNLLLGGLTCGSEPGQVERLEARVRVPGEAAPRVLSLACGDVGAFSELPARVDLGVYVSAFGADSVEPFAGAQCRGLTAPGTSVLASCSPLRSSGTLRVDVASELAALELGCDASISEVTIEVPGAEAPERLPPPDCRQPFDLDFPAGAAAVALHVLRETQVIASLTCFGDVEPASLVLAECEPAAAP